MPGPGGGDAVNQSVLSRLLHALVPLEVRGPNGPGLGTTFLFSTSQGGAAIPVLVANRGFIERAELGRFYFTRAEDGRAVPGEHLAFEMPEFSTLWHPHPDPRIDLAVAPFGPILSQLERAGRTPFVSPLDQALIPGGEDPEVDVVEEVLVLGFVGGLLDRAHILPLAQRGVTASPFQVDHEELPEFVVQVPVYPGMGGSPVIVARREDRPGAGTTERVSRVRLLGALSRVAEWKEGGLTFVPIPPAPPSAGAAWVSFGTALRAEEVVVAAQDMLRALGAHDT